MNPYPYEDLWDPLRRVFDAFDFDRCLWGTDWTRAVNLLTYEQGVTPFRLTDRLSDDERAESHGRRLAADIQLVTGDHVIGGEARRSERFGDPAIAVLRGIERQEGNPWVIAGRSLGII